MRIRRNASGVQVAGKIIFKFTPKSNRIYLLLGIISTFHYAVLYALMGQLFFGAIIANRIRL